MAPKKSATSESTQNANLKRSWQLKKKNVSFMADEKTESRQQNKDVEDNQPKKRKLSATEEDTAAIGEARKRFKLTPNNWQKRQQTGKEKKKKKQSRTTEARASESKASKSKAMAPKPEETELDDSNNPTKGTPSKTSIPKISTSKTRLPNGNAAKAASSSKLETEVTKRVLKSGKNFKITKTTTVKKPIKVHSTAIPEPEGLIDQFSTSEWDMYSEKMPSPTSFGPAVNDKIEWWFGGQDSALMHQFRIAQYGEDIANAFPEGGTPGYARWLCREREAASQ